MSSSRTSKAALHQLIKLSAALGLLGSLVITFQQCAPAGQFDSTTSKQSSTVKSASTENLWQGTEILDETNYQDTTPAPSSASSITYTQNGQSQKVELSGSGGVTITHEWQSIGISSVQISYRLISGSCTGHAADDTSWHVVATGGSSGSISTSNNGTAWAGCVFEFKAEGSGSGGRFTSQTLQQCWGSGCHTTTSQAPFVTYKQNDLTSRITMPASGDMEVKHEWTTSNATSFNLSYRLKSGSCSGHPQGDTSWHTLQNSGLSGVIITYNPDASIWNGCVFEFRAQASGPGGQAATFREQCWGSACETTE